MIVNEISLVIQNIKIEFQLYKCHTANHPTATNIQWSLNKIPMSCVTSDTKYQLYVEDGWSNN